MSASVSGTGGVTFPNGSVLASGSTALINRVIDGGFIINQRGYVSGTALAAGVYAHDRWKAGSGGGTYTFTQAATGVNTTITITAGTFVQVIEGCNVPEGGTYTLSWTGTAQGRVNSGSYGASPLTVTGLTAGSNVTIEFNTGTLGSVQFEAGSAASSFNYRSYPQELALCQRYYWKSPQSAPGEMFSVYQSNAGLMGTTNFPVTMRSTPTMTYGYVTPYSGNTFYQVVTGVTETWTLTANSVATNRVQLVYDNSKTGKVLGDAWTTYMTASAEL